MQIKPEDKPALATLMEKMISPGDIVFSVDQGLEVMRITGDGCLKRGAGFATDDAASIAFFDVLSRCAPSWIAELRQRAEKAEAELERVREELFGGGFHE